MQGPELFKALEPCFFYLSLREFSFKGFVKNLSTYAKIRCLRNEISCLGSLFCGQKN